MAQFQLLGTSYFKDKAYFSDYVCTNCGCHIQTFGEKVYPNLRECPICNERCEERKDNVSKVKVKRIPKKCCKTCRYSSLKNIAYIKDGGKLQYTQKRYCFAEKEPSEVKDDWGANCDKWKPIERKAEIEG